MPKLKIGFGWYVAGGHSAKICGFGQLQKKYLGKHFSVTVFGKNLTSKTFDPKMQVKY